jgi:protoporphyrinogen oxidase
MSPKCVMSPKRVVVVGSGITGITAAYFEARKGHSVTLIDSDNRVGGLLKSDFCNGQYFDYGTHILSETSNKELNDFLFSELDRDNCILADKIETYCYFNGEINFKNACMDINTLPQEVYLQACYELITAAETDVSDLESFFISRFGKTIYEAVFKDVVKKYFGMDANLLSEKMGYFFDMSRVLAFDVQTTKELTKIGKFNRKLGHHIRESGTIKYYPKVGGIGRIVEILAEKVAKEGVELKLSTKLQKVKEEKGKVVSLLTEEEEIKVDKLIWTLPSGLLASLSGLDAKAPPPKFRNTGLFDFTYEDPLNLDAVFLNVYDSDLYTGRVTLYQNLSKSDNYSCTVEVLTDHSIDLESLIDTIERELVEIGVVNQDNRCVFRQFRSIKSGFPVFTTECIKYQNSLSEYCENHFQNVLFVGRTSGQVFFMNDVLTEAVRKINGESNVD